MYTKVRLHTFHGTIETAQLSPTSSFFEALKQAHKIRSTLQQRSKCSYRIRILELVQS
jgi:hypothetical protein